MKVQHNPCNIWLLKNNKRLKARTHAPSFGALALESALESTDSISNSKSADSSADFLEIDQQSVSILLKLADSLYQFC